MNYGDSWSLEWIPDELKKMLGDYIIEGYYKWKLKINGTGFAHIFLCTMSSQYELEENWKKVVDGIAVYVQSEVTDILERSNFYVWFFVSDDVKKELVKEIEDNTYSSRKFVVSKSAMPIEEKLNMVRKKLFAFDFEVPESYNPMITRVEFQNFRVYKGKKNFDFVLNGKPARLIVLFAPNGMGKTSFFDGIEWGLSGTVGRFTEIADKNISGMPVLKNTEAGLDESAYVKIYQEGDRWIGRKVSELNDRTQKDFGTGRVDCSKKNSLKEYMSEPKAKVWGNVILPHHKIDGFIAGMKPTALYKEWGILWDTDGKMRQQFEEAYKRKRKESVQYEEVKKKYEELMKQYEKLNTSRSFVEVLERDVKHFRDVSHNTVIEKLNFSNITATEYIQWSNKVDNQFDLYEKNVQALERKYSYVDREIKRDIETYCTLLTKKKEDICEQNNVKLYLTQCQEKVLLLEQKKELETSLGKLEHHIKEARFFYDKGEEWFRDVKHYLDADNQIEKLKKMLSDMEGRISCLQNEADKFTIELKQKQKRRSEEKEYEYLCEHAKEMAKIREDCERFAVKKKDCEKQILDRERGISEGEKKCKELEERKIKNFDSVVIEWQDKESVYLEEDEQLQSICASLLNQLKKYWENQEKSSLLIQQMLAEEKTGKRIQQILTDSRSVIEEEKLSYCPVCNTNFNNFQELINSTYNNISKEGVKRKEEKQKLDNEMSEVRHYAEDIIEKYNKYLDTLIGKLRDENERLNRDYFQACKEKEEIEEIIRVQSDRKAEIERQDRENEIFVVYEEEGIRNWRSLWNAKLDQEIDELNAVIQKNEEQRTAYCAQIDICRKELDDTKDFILRMEAQQSASSTRIRDAELLIKQKTYSTLKDWIDSQTAEYEKLQNKISIYNEKLEKLYNISVLREAEYDKRDKQIQEQMEKTEKDLLPVRERIEKTLAIELPLEEDIMGYLNGIADEKRKELLQEKEHINMCIEALGKLKYNREIENYFLRWKEIVGQLEEAAKAEKAEEKLLKKAEENYVQQKQSVENKMRNFLRKYQMGEIYEKLEPHEKLKHLLAEFSFDEKEQPGLSFGVAGVEGDTYPPAWFLSTAQLNVVAFAIFLGRALQAEDVPLRSIFIDDPIGHFDEMNIVAFVDLLRNILENTDRQLIISTHEERVFRLIKRKMPQERYPACYIDFREEWM